MALVRIRFYVVRGGKAYWQPSSRMRKAGFEGRPLGPDGPAAIAEAERLTAQWDAHRHGNDARPGPRPGSLADVWERYRRMTAWAAKAPRTREEWELVWETLGPVFGDMPVAEIDGELVDAFYGRLAETVSLHKRHRIIKVFRAMLEVAISMRLITTNPTLVVTNTAPAGRSEIWPEDAVPLLVAAAGHMGYAGLALAIRIAYDSHMQPVDVRRLTLAHRRRDPAGSYFETARAKTGKKAFATLTRATDAALDAYVASLPGAPIPSAPILRNRSGAPYTKDKLAADFRRVRSAIFTAAETRRLQDMRRTGNVEAALGGALPQALSAKAGSTIGQSSKLFETYTPVQLAAVREADAARPTGRRKLRGEG